MTYSVWHASVIGPSHVELGYPCQDSCSTAMSMDEKWFAIVVCDGCGSAKRADEAIAWYGLGVPIGDPADIVLMLRSEISDSRHAQARRVVHA